jgi:(R)-2-hydroxyacyl-CoA dehydratese activating ATPase
MTYTAGVDAGSTYIKVAVMGENGAMAGQDLRPTGMDAAGTSKKMIESIMASLGQPRSSIERIVATGYSRRVIDVADETVTEIKAHSAGAPWSAPAGVDVRTVIDIGGQDSKIIVIDGTGEAIHFAMNDKCAAGTGRFLESLSRVLELEIQDLGPISLESVAPVAINSICAVFAESEVISLVARKKKRRDIVAGIHQALARRIGGMARKARIEPEVLLTGGGGLNAGIIRALEEELRLEVFVPEYPQLNGAIGAALIADRERDGFRK